MNETNTTATAAEDNTITLDTPIRRGETVIDKITLRKPRSGELRGVSLTDLLQMDVNALCMVLPRISSPMVLKQEAGDLDPADLVQIGTKVAAFLLTKTTLASASPSAWRPRWRTWPWFFTGHRPIWTPSRSRNSWRGANAPANGPNRRTS